MKNAKDLVMLMLEQPMVDWETTIKVTSLPYGAIREAVRQLDGDIERMSRLRGYLDGRDGHGCGYRGHTISVKESNRLVAKVRRALGYAIPRQDLRF